MNVNKFLIYILISVFLTLVGLKVFYFNYSPAMVLPETGYKFKVNITLVGHGNEVRVRMPLPIQNERQTILNEISENSEFNFTNYQQDLNRFGLWQNFSLKGKKNIYYEFDVLVKKTIFNLPDKILNNKNYGKEFDKYLNESKLVQVGSADMTDLAADLGLTRNNDQIKIVKTLYDFITYKIDNAGFSGKTDAITALRLKEASCNGKSRLFVAMLRTLGIPARLVGGIILNEGEKRVGHQWIEAYLGSYWVPFDPTNKHYAELPKNYLIFYYGDQPFFQHTANINFNYEYIIDRKQFPRETNYSGLASHPLNIMNAWSLFQKSGLPLDLLKIILMIPIGAVVTIILRNVVGIKTFGTFLPVLIASSFRESGLLWGGVSFVSIILLGSIIRLFLDKLRIAHTPKLTILLVFVVLSLLSISAIGVSMGNMSLAKANIFPLALMAITIERFGLIAQENGTKDALKIFLNTIIVVIINYFVIHSLFLQTIVMAFPETMLLVICAGLYFGNWIGLRLSEVIRFRALVFSE